MKSGLRAAGEEFMFGVYDGVTGLILQPYNGVKRDGVKGLVPGIGKGLFGFVLKDLAAIIGPVGYTLKGVHKEMVKSRQPTAFIRRARIMQGWKDKDSLKKAKVQETEARVEKAWAIVVEIMKEVDRTKDEGLSSRWAVARERRRLVKTGAFESVETAEQAFQIWKRERDRENSASTTTTITATTAPATAPTPAAHAESQPSRESSRNRKETITTAPALAERRLSSLQDKSRSRSRSRSRNRKETTAYIQLPNQIHQVQSGIPNGNRDGAEVNGTKKQGVRNEGFHKHKDERSCVAA